MFAAADEQVRAAGAILAGGHTIRDEEPKYGLAVVGTVHPDAVWPKSGARPGDAVFLTKPLGTGLVLAAHGEGAVSAERLDEATRWMTTLNAAAADALQALPPERRHRRHRLRAARARARDGRAKRRANPARGRVRSRRSAGRSRRRATGSAPAAIRATATSPRPHVTSDGVGDDVLALAYDAQTAGGLLVTLPSDKALSLEAEFARAGLFLARVGAVEEGEGVVLAP